MIYLPTIVLYVISPDPDNRFDINSEYTLLESISHLDVYSISQYDIIVNSFCKKSDRELNSLPPQIKST